MCEAELSLKTREVWSSQVRSCYNATFGFGFAVLIVTNTMILRSYTRAFSFLVFLLVGAVVESTAYCQESAQPKIEVAKLGETRNVHSFGKNLLCGQPSQQELADAKERGIKVILTLRTEGENTWDEKAVVEELGLEFHRLGFLGPDTLSDLLLDEALKILAESKDKPVMMHCASANRVGAIWMAHRVVNEGLPVEEALREAKEVGLRTPSYEARVRDYIERKPKLEKSVKPGINDRFFAPNFNIDEWIGRFEVESREVFAGREAVLKACSIKPGYRIADIGAGTGFYSRMFAGAVGDQGWVYAVDIIPQFLRHVNAKMAAEKVGNVTTVLSTERSVQLPPSSVDLVFICDTYHHFEYPQSTLASIYGALKPNGTLVVIDFERIPGESREFILGHVRAGKDVFKREIQEAGFQFVDEVKVPTFKENYLLRFRKQ